MFRKAKYFGLVQIYILVNIDHAQVPTVIMKILASLKEPRSWFTTFPCTLCHVTIPLPPFPNAAFSYLCLTRNL